MIFIILVSFLQDNALFTSKAKKNSTLRVPFGHPPFEKISNNVDFSLWGKQCICPAKMRPKLWKSHIVRPLLRSSGGLLASEAETRSSHCLHNFMSHERGHCFTGSAKKTTAVVFDTHPVFAVQKTAASACHDLPLWRYRQKCSAFLWSYSRGCTFVTMSSQK